MLEKGSMRATAKGRRSVYGRLLFTVAFAFAPLLFFPLIAQAQTAEAVNTAQTVAQAAGVGGQTDLLTIIGRIINIALGFLGVILLCIMLYAGFLWMTAGGDEEKVKTAQKWIRNAIIGLIIIVSAFGITQMILGWLSGISNGGGFAPPEQTVGGVSFPSAAGSLGGDIIEYHVPMRDATNVPRNTSIAISFKEPINPASVIEGWTEETSSTATGIKSAAIKIFPTGQPTQVLGSADVRVMYTDDKKMYVFRPVHWLGSPVHNTGYTVNLVPGTDSIKRMDGRSPFTGDHSSGYSWQFEVSTVVDLTPPQVTAVIPSHPGHYAPNIVVQVNFNEAIDPTSASGIFNEHPAAGARNFQNIVINSSPASSPSTVNHPNGEFKISNHFQTVEFVSNVPCGVNSCGRTVYCLPFNSHIDVTAKAATLASSSTVPQAVLTRFGFDGIVDMAGNSLDGNGDGTAQGSDNDDAFARGNDNYNWAFGTNGQVNLAPPTITATVPGFTASHVPVDQEPQADFDDVLQAATVVSDNASVSSSEPNEYRDTFWFTPFQTVVTSTVAGDEVSFGRVSVQHRIYMPTQPRWTPDYDPYMTSGLQNIYQNCFNPAGGRSGIRVCSATRGSPYCCDGDPSPTPCSLPPPLFISPTPRP